MPAYKKILAGTNNKGKIIEIKQILGEVFEEIVSPKDLGLNIDVEENGTTFFDNALIKAKAFSEATGLPALADDSGLCVNALNGEPGVYSARYMGEGHTDQERTNYLLSNLSATGSSDRSAYFCSAVVIYYPDGTYKAAEGRCTGIIAEAPTGDNGFGYDPVFVPDGYSESFGVLPSELKNKISHRANALKNLLKVLSD